MTISTTPDLSGITPISGPDVSVDELLSDAASKLFSEVSDFDTVQAAEEAGWAPTVWKAVAEAGFAWIGVDETAGGSGGTLADACEVLRIAGANAAPIPLAETGILGGWLLASAGLSLPEGPITFSGGRPDDTLSIVINGDGTATLDGTLHRVPWATRADVLAVLDPATNTVIAAPNGSYTTEAATNMAGEPRETVLFAQSTIDEVSVESLRNRGALSRTMLMAGALEAMLDLTVDYTETRQQFGRPVGRFQAVQQHLVWTAQDAAITKMAAQLAARQAARGDGRFEIAAARTLANETAGTATRQCHQAHGAMGMTQEYALHHLSRRLWAWRSEWSGPGEWSQKVGRMAEQVGPANLYPLITGGSALLSTNG
jgi:acyl-CoA dehydrogenase